MKHFLLVTLTPALFLLEGRSSEPQGKPASPAPANEATRVSPMTHPWDTNAWEPGSAAIFWHKTSRSQPLTPASRTVPPKKQDPNFSSRQSEK